MNRFFRGMAVGAGVAYAALGYATDAAYLVRLGGALMICSLFFSGDR